MSCKANTLDNAMRLAKVKLRWSEWKNEVKESIIFLCWHRVFHGLGQAKFPDGGSVLGSSQFSTSKNNTRFKSGQIDLKIIISLL